MKIYRERAVGASAQGVVSTKDRFRVGVPNVKISRCVRMAALKPDGVFARECAKYGEYEWYRGIFRLIALAMGRFLFVINIRTGEENRRKTWQRITQVH